MGKEGRRKERLIMELGQKAWERRIEIKNGINVFRELQYLAEKTEKLEKEVDDIDTKISFLKTSLDENTKKVDVRLNEKEDDKSPHVEKLLEFKGKEEAIGVEVAEKQAELETIAKDISSTRKNLHEAEEDGLEWGDEKKAEFKGVQDKLDELERLKEELDAEIKTLVGQKAEFEEQRKEHEKSIGEIEKEITKIEHDQKHQTKDCHKEIREWEKNRHRISDKIEKVAKEREPLFTKYGGLVEKERVSDRELKALYSQIDRASARIEEIEKQIEALD
jgi:chromosome segregation ATPase